MIQKYGYFTLTLFIIILNLNTVVFGETFIKSLPLTNATAYDPAVDYIVQQGSVMGGTTGYIEPENGYIYHNAAIGACALSSWGWARIGIDVQDGIRSDYFTVTQSGTYKLVLSGKLNGSVMEGSTSILAGVGKTTGILYIAGKLSGENATDFSIDNLHEMKDGLIDFITDSVVGSVKNIISYFTTVAGTATNQLIDVLLGLDSIKEWDSKTFNIASYNYLEAGKTYSWTFYIRSIQGSAQLIGGSGVALYDMEVSNLLADLYSMDDLMVHTVSVSSGQNGSITPDGDILIGDNQEVQFQAIPNNGYKVNKWYVNSVIVGGGVNGLLIENVTENKTVYVTFIDDEPDPAIQGNSFNITNSHWDDNNAVLGDHDHIMEAGERVKLEVRLESDDAADNVYATLSTSDPDINITDSGTFYDDFISGQSQWSDSWFDMDLNFTNHRNSNFMLHVAYDVSGQSYFQELTFSKTFYSQGEFEPSFKVTNVAIDDSPSYDGNNNGDGIFQSGEEIRFRPEIKNTGDADARDDVEVFLLPSNENVSYSEDVIGYPDLPKDSSAYPSSSDFRADADYAFAGTHLLDLHIEWADGTNSAELPAAFSFTVQPVAWGRVMEDEFNFGLVSPSEIVTHTMTIENYGSTGMQITGIEITDEQGNPVSDTTTNIATVYISAGQSSDIGIEIDTTTLDGAIVRQITFNTDGRIKKSEHAIMTLSGYVADNATVVRSVPFSTDSGVADIGNGWIVWNANSDIFAYNIQTGENKQLTLDAADQRNPRVSEDIVVWEDSRNQIGEETNYDIYGYDLQTDQEFVVASDTADEFIVDIDGSYVAYCRFYHRIDRDGWWASPLYNLWIKNLETDLSTNLTGFVDLGNNPMRSVKRTWPAPGFGDGLIVWQEYEVYWNSDKNQWRSRDSQVWKFMIGSDSIPVITIPASSYAPGWSIYFPTADGQFAWVNWVDDDDGKADSIWIGETGSSHQEIYEPAESLAQHVFAIGGGYIVFDMRYTPGIFYWDISSNEQSLLSAIDPANYSTRMDGSGVVWKSSGGLGDNSLQYAFIHQPDIALSSVDLVFSDNAPFEGDSIDVSIKLQNITDYNFTDNITVRLYDSDPDSGATQLGVDQVLSGGISANSQQTVNFTGIVIPDGSGGSDEAELQIHVRIIVPGYDNPDNNTTKRYLTVYDNDTKGPLISNVLVEEYNGDGDGIIGDDEQIKISWNLTDSSGIGSISLSVDGSPIGLDGDYYAILDPLDAGVRYFNINCVDADTSPALSQYDGSFDVVVSERIAVFYNGVLVNDNSILNVSNFPLGTPNTSILFVIRNDGDQTLILEDPIINVTRGDIACLGPSTSNLPDGSFIYFTIMPDTRSIGTFSGIISITNSDSNKNPFNFTVSGEVHAPLPEDDLDSDGMLDIWESSHNLDPKVDDSNNDSDNDGLPNLEEYYNSTDPNNSDTDGDKMPDGWEVGYGLDPSLNDANEDTDGDGVKNILEYIKGTDPLDPGSYPPRALPWLPLLLGDD